MSKARFSTYANIFEVRIDPLWYGTRYNLYIDGNKVGWCYKWELTFVKETQ